MKNSSRTWLERENENFASSLPSGSIVLDAGAGGQRHAKIMAHCVYETADFEMVVDKKYGQTTYVCDLAEIPVADCRFDALLFNQVMEHLPDPLVVLKELKRVMKPGARAICSAPLFYEEHEKPYDFYRYTQFGWRHLMTKAGFELERIDWMEGYFGTVAYQMETASKQLRASHGTVLGGLRGRIAQLKIAAAKRIFGHLAPLFYDIDEAGKYTGGGYPKNYVVIIRKPLEPAE